MIKKTPGVAFYGKVRIPTIGHKAAIDQAKDIATKTGGKLTIGLSGTAEPLDIKTKKSHAEKVFGHPVDTGTEHTKTLASFLSHLHKSHDHLHLVAGSDRVEEYKSFLQKYNGKKDKKGNVPFHFKSYQVHAAGGERKESNKDPRKMSRAELTSSVSASKLEKLAKEGNYEHFKAYHPGMPEGHVRKVFTQIRKHHSLNEEVTRKELAPMLDSFVSFASDKLGLKSLPSVRYKTDKDGYNSFAAYNPSKNELSISTKNRHPMDVFRSVAHELVHHKQNEDGKLGKDIEKEGATGSDIENEANAEAGKIMRWFAKANPNMFDKTYVVEETIVEGINDPGKLKAIFLAGGPGSGKDYVMNSVLRGEGLKEVNSDVAFEYLMQKNGLDLEMPDSERVERDIVRGRAKNITKEQERLALAGRLGLIINGTADDLEKIKTVKKNLEADGYETMMVFVNTSNEVSRERNVERGKMGKRKVPDGTDKNGVPDNSPNIRQEKWDLAQKNIGELQKIFGNENFAVVDNTADIRKVSPEEKEKIQTNFNRVRRMAQQFVRADNKNPAAKVWIEKEAQKRGITYQEPRATKTLTQIRQEIPNVVHKPDNELMVQARKLGLSYYGFGRFGRKVGNENKVLYHSRGGKLIRVQPIHEDLRNWFSKTHPEGNWKRVDTKGNIKGDCAREPGEGKPKCMPASKAYSMSKEDRAKSARRKRREDPVANRSGKGNTPINVKTESVQKAIDRINADRISEGILTEKNQPTNPSLWSKAKSLAKSKFDVYPSAYANGWAAKWYKSKGGGWKTVNEACWSGYDQQGMKKKGNRMVPNCVPVEEGRESIDMEKEYKKHNRIKKKVNRPLAETIDTSFEKYMVDPANREVGTNSVAKIYKKMTPGQEVAEDNVIPRGKFGLPKSGGLGPEYGIQVSPALVTGFGNIGNAVYETSKSIQEWAMNPKTQQKFAEKYGNLAEQKLIDAALRLEAAGCGSDMTKPKSVKKIKETAMPSYPSAKDPQDQMGTVPVQVKEEQLNERGADSKGLYRSTESGAGLTRKGAKKFGVKTAVTTPPSKLDPNGKAAKRRKSFCARMSGMKGPMKDEKGRPTRKAMSLRRWNCEE